MFETGDLNGDDENAFNVANKLAAAEAERDAGHRGCAGPEQPITCDWCTNPTLQVAREHCEAELCPFKAKLEAAEQAETSYY